MKKFKFLQYLIPFVLAAGLVWGAASDYKVDNLGRIFGYDLIVKGPWVDARAYATLELANTAAYNAGKTLLIAQNYTLTANTTLTASVKRIPGGSFTKASTYTLAITGKFVNPDNGQAFIGFSSGDVTFGAGAVKEVYPEWWGAKGDADGAGAGTNDSVALQSAINAYRNIKITKKYKITTALEIGNVNGFTLRGIGAQYCGIYPAGVNGFNITGTSPSWSQRLTFQDFTLADTTSVAATTGFNCTGYVFHGVWERLTIYGFTTYSINMLGGLHNKIRDCYFSSLVGNTCIHLRVVRHPTDGAPTTLVTEGNYYAYGSANASYPIVYIEDISCYVSIQDIFENANKAMVIKKNTGGTARVVIINPYAELLTNYRVYITDVTQAVLIGGLLNFDVTWSTVPADQRYYTQLNSLGYGEVLGVSGISSTSGNSYNLRGTCTISGTAIYGSWIFTKPEPDTNYYVLAVPTAKTGTPAAGSNRVLYIEKAIAAAYPYVEVAPGAGNSVTFDLILIR